MAVFAVVRAELYPGGEKGLTPVPISILAIPDLKGVECHFMPTVIQFRAVVTGPAYTKGISITSSSWTITDDQYQNALLLWDC